MDSSNVALNAGPVPRHPLEIVDRWLNPDHIRLHAGEMAPQEMRTVLAVLRAVRSEIASVK